MIQTILIVQLITAIGKLPDWEDQAGRDSLGKFSEAISKDASTSSIIAKLSRTVGGVQADVEGYLKTFEAFSFLWLKDLTSEYAAFLATNPVLEVRRHNHLSAWSGINEAFQ